MNGLALGTCFVVSILGCDRAPAEPTSRRSVVAPPPTLVALSDKTSRPNAARLVAIGDLHGDLEATRKALRLAGAIDAKDTWIGGNLVVVQTGDAIDRGDDDRTILDLLERLGGEAKRAGGELIAMSGNHEIMNVALDFRYVTPTAFAAFAGVASKAAIAVPEVERARAAAFAPMGVYATMLAEHPIVMRVGDTVFVHGGVLRKHVAYGIDKMNAEVRDWMLGRRPSVPEIVGAEDGPVWTRSYSGSADLAADVCAQLGDVLASLGAKRMVVGHTVQAHGITSACQERVWRIDVGMSRFFGGAVQVLEIAGGQIRVRRGELEDATAPPP